MEKLELLKENDLEMQLTRGDGNFDLGCMDFCEADCNIFSLQEPVCNWMDSTEL